MDDIYKLVNQFRSAIESAKNAREFVRDLRFRQFPTGCCDDTCDLLAHYLLEHGIRSRQIVGTYSDGNPENNTGHAWLQLDDQTIIDITGDQFKYYNIFLNFDKAIYIGYKNNFYKLFKRVEIYENCKIDDNSRLLSLYQTIMKYIT